MLYDFQKVRKSYYIICRIIFLYVRICTILGLQICKNNNEVIFHYIINFLLYYILYLFNITQWLLVQMKVTKKVHSKPLNAYPTIRHWLTLKLSKGIPRTAGRNSIRR